jgi:hypothetical protein
MGTDWEHDTNIRIKKFHPHTRMPSILGSVAVLD